MKQRWGAVVVEDVAAARGVGLIGRRSSFELEPEQDALAGALSGASAAIEAVLESAQDAALSQGPLLLFGEPGTGKSSLARAVHGWSPRAMMPFRAVTCGSASEDVLERELFGWESGVPRGGHFEEAKGGTIFLEDVGALTPALQVNLLRVIREGTLVRVGGTSPVAVAVRIVTSSSCDLANEVSSGRFREDLLFALSGVVIEMPSLRSRGDDVMVLASRFLRRFAAENGKTIDSFAAAVCTKMLAHPWPGNLPELEHWVERAVVLCESARITMNDLPFDAHVPAVTAPRIPGSTMAQIERYVIEQTLEAVDGSTARAAEMLDISIRTVQYRQRAYGISPKRTH